jgi:hypothetical protein
MTAKFDGLLTNYEVYSVLSEYEKKRTKSSLGSLQNRDFVEIHARSYFKSLNKGIAKQSWQRIQGCVESIKNLLGATRLNEAEILQLINHTPSLEVELHLVGRRCIII